jgi:hypothetical protein
MQLITWEWFLKVTELITFLTDTDSFFLLTDIPNGLKYFVRSPIKTAMEGDFDTGNMRFKARERYSFGWSDPRCVFGNGNLPTSLINTFSIYLKGAEFTLPLFLCII